MSIDNFYSKKNNLEKKIKMLHNHEYDPDCKYCSSNKFVKDAKDAEKTLPNVESDINHLISVKVQLDKDLSDLDILTVEDRKSVV